jgi:hypothetical protein
VVHTPGGPGYADPARRFVFLDPPGTFALWAPGFGAHWIVWTDGSVWPRHPAQRESPYWQAQPGDPELLRRIAREAAPVYAHAYSANADSVGIEVAHGGRSDEPFPAVQVRALACLLRGLVALSGGRLTPASVVGHKDVDRRPAYLSDRCQRVGCAVHVDGAGLPLRRRVDPPESLFAALAAEGFVVPRPAGDLDAELRRAEALPAGQPAAAARR